MINIRLLSRKRAPSFSIQSLTDNSNINEKLKLDPYDPFKNIKILNYQPINNVNEELIWDNISSPKRTIHIPILKYIKNNNNYFPSIQNDIYTKPKYQFNLLDEENINKIKKNEIDYIAHCYKAKSHSLKKLLAINKMNNIPFKKFNLILDLELTIINSTNKRKVTDPNFFKNNDNLITINFFKNDKKFEYCFKFRPYLLDFLKNLNQHFNFYISSLSDSLYVYKIIEQIQKKADITFTKIESNSDKNYKHTKCINDIIPLDNIDEINNTIIIDDNIMHWMQTQKKEKITKEIQQCIKCLIPSKRFEMEAIAKREQENYDLLIYNNIFKVPYNDKIKYIEKLDYKFSIEKDTDFKEKKINQLVYIERFLKNCMKLCLYSGLPLVEVIDFFRKKIFEKCRFNLKYIKINKENNTNFIPIIIKELGGMIVEDIDETTHYIIGNENRDSNIQKKNGQKCVNIYYIIQCYFNLNRFNEYSTEFNPFIKNNNNIKNNINNNIKKTVNNNKLFIATIVNK